ncbi:PD-(D/E)XK nuclease family protein [Oscillospiraceae bacterium PP1C4]
MLHLILGTAGTGKTTLLHERIQSCVEGGGKAILIVPEQYSFESEKLLYRRLGAQNALSVEVLSFTRLCDQIFRELGGIAGVHMDETAKYLLMSVALGELGDALTSYKRNSAGAAFVSSMCDTISELKAAGVTPEKLLEIAADSESADFAGKLSDIAMIFDAYQAIIERGYSDPDDNLARACKALEQDDSFFGGYSVFIDGFMAFMGAEWKLLGHVLGHSMDVTVALTCEGLNDTNKTSVFTAVTKTASRMVELAKKNASRVTIPVVLRETKRFKNPALAQIATDFPKLRHTMCDFEPNGIAIVNCEDIYDELEYIASQIAALVREQGFRYREIALIGRSLDRYLVPLQTVFGRYDIPFFTDLRADIQVYPLVSGLLCALDAVRSGFESEYVLALAKTCISGIDSLDVGLLENYCFVWGITGGAWMSDFVNHPDGMVESFTEEKVQLLEKINTVRKRLIDPLIKLKKGLYDCDGRGFATAVFEYLGESGAAQNLQDSALLMEENESKQFLETGAQVWDIIIGLLDVFGSVLSGLHLPFARMIDLFRLSVATADIGSLPQTLDQVIVGTADRIRPSEPKAVFVTGLNEGEFPLWSISTGIFSAAERDRLGAQGVDLLRTPEQYALFEKYFVYFALTQASQRLWLTYPQKDTAGNGLAPSTVISQVKEIVGNVEHSSDLPDTMARIYNEKTAFDVMTRSWTENSPEVTALKRYFADRHPDRMTSLDAFCGERDFKLSDKATARALFGKELRISPSKVERYYACPFAYFCQVGLRLNTRKRVEFNPIESGSLIHLVLEKIVRKHGGKGLSEVDDETMKAEITAIINDDLISKIQDFDGMPARFKYLFRRLVNTLLRLIKRLALEFAQSEFEPEAFELSIHLDKEIKPLNLQTADGTRVIVEGIVDRVDVLHKDGTDYVRVVDYKSGRKNFNLADVFYGLNMQMLIYLFSICENSSEDAQQKLPAGVLYMPARDNIVVAQRNESDQVIREEQVKRLKMSGILLEDREVLSAMEPELAGVFIPVKTKKDGSFSAASSLATISQMGAIKRQVEHLLLALANELYGGNIAAAPVDGLADYTPCDWCDYHAVCAHEDGDAVRKLADMDKNAALEMMEKEGENDG